jgi:catechol 2,3-dioxygenase-like lactoylglutathione lyase family enzyme
MSESIFDHVTIRVSDQAASVAFYTPLLEILGFENEGEGTDIPEWGVFSLGGATPDKPVTRNAHIAFCAPSRELVDAFWQAGVDAGHRDDGAPGPRPEYSEDYYGGFLRDPDGNSIEAVHHGTTHLRDQIDHVWMRVADVHAAREFYEVLAPHSGFEARSDPGTGRLHCSAPNGGFTLVEGTPTQNLHLAFPARDEAAVDAFHRDLTSRGYTDNGPPGERLVYHAGYYGAFVLDPDGNNIELVHHGGARSA